MRTLKHLAVFAVVVMVAVFMAAPSAMAKKQLAEDELELITAAGQPKVIETQGTTSPIDFTDNLEVNIAFDTQSQQTLTALTLNNVVGENQVANGINIQASAVSPQAPQTVSITQSWGSIKDLSFATVSAPGGAGCASGAEKCFNTKGGAGSTKMALLSALADDIVMTEGDLSAITVNQIPQFDLVFSSEVQKSLAALVVNNIAGINQVANGINVQSGAVAFTGGVTLAGSGGSTAPAGNQSVTINQWRGVAAGRPQFNVP